MPSLLYRSLLVVLACPIALVAGQSVVGNVTVQPLIPFYFAFDIPLLLRRPSSRVFNALRDAVEKFVDERFREVYGGGSLQGSDVRHRFLSSYQYQDSDVETESDGYNQGVPEPSYNTYSAYGGTTTWSDGGRRRQLQSEGGEDELEVLQQESIPTPEELFETLRTANFSRLTSGYVAFIPEFASVVGAAFGAASDYDVSTAPSGSAVPTASIAPSLAPTIVTIVSLKPFYVACNVPSLLFSPTQGAFENLAERVEAFFDATFRATLNSDSSVSFYESVSLEVSTSEFNSDIPSDTYNVYQSYVGTVKFSRVDMPTSAALYTLIAESDLEVLRTDYIRTLVTFSSVTEVVVGSVGETVGPSAMPVADVQATGAPTLMPIKETSVPTLMPVMVRETFVPTPMPVGSTPCPCNRWQILCRLLNRCLVNFPREE